MDKMIYNINHNVAEYFQSVCDIEDKKILDFGCAHGNFLKYDWDGDYTGLDVRLDIIEKNRKEYPNRKWIHYDRHNTQYNIKSENKNGHWPLIEKYDFICAFSVFTHTSFKEYEYTINMMKDHLNSEGKILTTFIDGRNFKSINSTFQYRKDILCNLDMEEIINKCHKHDTVSFLVDVKTLDYVIYCDVKDIPDFNNECFFMTYYKTEWLEEALKGKSYNVNVLWQSSNDIRGTQKCLVI